jgi:hypothetical protein
MTNDLRILTMSSLLALAIAGGASCSAGESPGPRSQRGNGGVGGSSGSGVSGGPNTGGNTGGTGGSSTGGSSAGGSSTGGSGGASGAGGSSTGGSSTGGSGGASGAGGTTVRDASSDVSFDWPEGPRGQCKPGTYEGQFNCLFSQFADSGVDGGLFTLPVSGPITLHLSQSQNGEFLEVKDGVLDGTANTFFTLKATISGKLDCRTGQFEGSLDKGTYSGFILVNGTWSGRLTSSYDRMTFRFPAGTWFMYPDIGGECIGGGSWTATYTGP